LDRHLGSGANSAHKKDLKNVGPSVQYKLRDKTGQAREFLNYMQPIDVDGNAVFLSGTRDTPSEEFRYLRIPADDDYSLQEWMRLRAALMNPDLRAKAAVRYAGRALSQQEQSGSMKQQLEQSAFKSLSIFAGDGKNAGYLAVSHFLEAVPPAEQERAADIFMKVLNGSLWDLWQVARAQDGLPAVEQTEKHARFLQLAANALSDASFYNAPVYLQLSGFDEIKASVLQLTRSPGKKVVYLGCILLVLGVFSMLYIRERRLWIWIKPAPDGASAQALMAMSSQRKTLDFNSEFEALTARLQQSA
jgi:cytochrome c biogenesis protein